MYAYDSELNIFWWLEKGCCIYEFGGWFGFKWKFGAFFILIQLGYAPFYQLQISISTYILGRSHVFYKILPFGAHILSFFTLIYFSLYNKYNNALVYPNLIQNRILHIVLLQYRQHFLIKICALISVDCKLEKGSIRNVGFLYLDKDWVVLVNFIFCEILCKVTAGLMQY